MVLQGIYTTTGTQVTIKLLSGETFQGTVNGNSISGQGLDNVGPWSFKVNKVS
jgi:hypothetical protein